MEKQTEQLMNKFLEYLESGEAFIAEQAPDFINQLVVFETWNLSFSFWIYFSIFLVSLVLTVICAVKIYYTGPLIIFPSIAIVIFSILVASKYSDIKKLEMAPKVYLLEKAQKIFKGGCK